MEMQFLLKGEAIGELTVFKDASFSGVLLEK